MNVSNPQNHRTPTRSMRRVLNDLLTEYGLPTRLAWRITRADNIVQYANKTYVAYATLSRAYHGMLHTGVYGKCKNEVCAESHTVASAWRIAKNNHFTAQTRERKRKERRNDA